MTERNQPSAIDPKRTKDEASGVVQPNAITDTQHLMRMRKKRHLSGLMCPSMGAVSAPDFRQTDH